ncbi:MAG: tRNA 2-thiouridine(34) synthase MnmA [Candidatus Omnitrophica bacterium]|nr:tRNA 2-thiouridine(34) synthase MnmA [Candidatus Omnitrophota bacterium]
MFTRKKLVRVVVAMSGGVDSSVAAALLKQKGYEVIGITMCFNLIDSLGKKPNCCGLQGIEDARRVAHKLGIKHYVVNMQKTLQDKVIKDFCTEYASARTPNPCVRCNQYVKFGALLDKALSLDAKYLATGHFASIGKLYPGKKNPAAFVLKKAKDKKKDQSYFLYRLNQRQLKHIIFPLEKFTKQEVRNIARDFNLPVADKKESQEICFVPGMDYRAFLKKNFSSKSNEFKCAEIVDKNNKVVGEHKGIAFYTIGQREGIGVALGYPAYVTEINKFSNRITLGPKEDCLRKEFLVNDLHFAFKPIKNEIVLKVKIRYNHKEAAALIKPYSGKLKVCFKKAQFAITPGQSAVFYNRDKVIGGGIIDEVL